MSQINAPVLDQSVMPNVASAPNNYNISASPDAFGAGIGRASERLGVTVEQAGDMLMKHQVAFWQMQNETLAKEADVRASKRLVDLQFNEQNGFMYKFGKDAIDNLPAAEKAIQEVRNQALGALPNDHARNMFDQVFLRRMQYTQESMAAHAGQENKKWQIGTGQSRIDNEMNMLTTTAYDDDKFAVHVATIRAETISLAELQGMSPEQTHKLLDHNTSEAWQHRLNAINVHNPDEARAMFSLNADQIDAAHRPVIDQHILTHQEAFLRAGVMRDAKLQATAEREMKKTQGVNEANWLEKAYTNKFVDIHAVAEDVRTGQISVEGMKAVHSAVTAENKMENNDRKMHIWAHYAAGGDIRSEALAGGESGDLAPTTVVAMLRAGAEKPTQHITEQFHVLKTAAGGHDAENGFFKDPQLQKEAEIRWSSAQDEFWRRVHGTNGQKGEDPTKVVRDMIPRYVKVDLTPAAWPNPRMGMIHDSKDVQDVAIRTLQAYEHKDMSDATYQEEVKLLNKYKLFYAEQDRRKATLRSNKEQGQAESYSGGH